MLMQYFKLIHNLITHPTPLYISSFFIGFTAVYLIAGVERFLGLSKRITNNLRDG